MTICDRKLREHIDNLINQNFLITFIDGGYYLPILLMDKKIIEKLIKKIIFNQKP